MQIALKLTEILEERGRSLYWLSNETGLHYTTLWNLTRKTSGIAYRTLAAICEALSITPGDLLRLEEDEKPRKSGKKKKAKSPA